ncbi:hypothetical protein BG74_01080 [Sodalis-like endosymbiont of Proechinophthirus fluctus]|nr:hypothetical protein BG74_01080 [Sodalis-like endosymbiont of Proechinophthirus fluctus]
MADFSQTVILLSAKPQAVEIATLMAMAACAGNATGITLNCVTVCFGLPISAGEGELLVGKGILAVASLKQTAFVQPLAAKIAFHLAQRPDVGTGASALRTRLNNYLNGHIMFNQDPEEYRYLASTDDQLVRFNHDLQPAGIRGNESRMACVASASGYSVSAQ